MKRVNLKKRQIDLIEESVRVFERFNEMKRLYRENSLSFPFIEQFVDDRGKSCLFRLKEMCHDLYRNSDSALYKEKLYDMTVGCIFHEAMKLRENVYQLEYYRPESFVPKETLGEKERKIMREMESVIRKAEKRLREGFSELKKLLKDLSEQLKDLIILYRDNDLLPRFLLENEKSLIRTFGRKGYYEILKELFKNGKEKLIYLAGLSYLSSDFYNEAKNAFKKVLALDSSNKEALFFYNYSRSLLLYFKGKTRQSAIFAQKAKELGQNLSLDSSFISKLDELLSELKKEQRIKKTS